MEKIKTSSFLSSPYLVPKLYSGVAIISISAPSKIISCDYCNYNGSSTTD